MARWGEVMQSPIRFNNFILLTSHSFLDTGRKNLIMHCCFNHKPHPIMIQKHKRIIILIIASALFSMFTSSCGTMRGIGQDISGAGRGLQKAAS